MPEFYFCFRNAINSFQSHQNVQSFLRDLLCIKKLVVERKEEKNFSVWPLEYGSGKPAKFPRA